jgi:hypothetical protein
VRQQNPESLDWVLLPQVGRSLVDRVLELALAISPHHARSCQEAGAEAGPG